MKTKNTESFIKRQLSLELVNFLNIMFVIHSANYSGVEDGGPAIKIFCQKKMSGHRRDERGYL